MTCTYLEINLKKDEAFKVLCTQFIELERFLSSYKLEEFYRKLCEQRTNFYTFIPEFESVYENLNYLRKQVIVNVDLLGFQNKYIN